MNLSILKAISFHPASIANSGTIITTLSIPARVKMLKNLPYSFTFLVQKVSVNFSLYFHFLVPFSLSLDASLRTVQSHFMIFALIEDLLISLRLLSTHSNQMFLPTVHLVISKDLKPALKYILFSSIIDQERKSSASERRK